MNKKGRFIILWIFVAVYIFIFAIALIEPLKGPLQDSLTGLSCSTTTNNFIKPVCFLIKGGVVLFVGGILGYLIRWVYLNGQRR